MSMAAPERPATVVLSIAAAPVAANAATAANWMAVKAIGRPKAEALPVTTTCTAQKKAESATRRSPREKAPMLPPPRSQVPSADSTTAGQTMGYGTLPLQPQATHGVSTT